MSNLLCVKGARLFTGFACPEVRDVRSDVCEVVDITSVDPDIDTQKFAASFGLRRSIWFPLLLSPESEDRCDGRHRGNGVYLI